MDPEASAPAESNSSGAEPESSSGTAKGEEQRQSGSKDPIGGKDPMSTKYEVGATVGHWELIHRGMVVPAAANLFGDGFVLEGVKLQKPTAKKKKKNNKEDQ